MRCDQIEDRGTKLFPSTSDPCDTSHHLHVGHHHRTSATASAASAAAAVAVFVLSYARTEFFDSQVKIRSKMLKEIAPPSMACAVTNNSSSSTSNTSGISQDGVGDLLNRMNLSGQRQYPSQQQQQFFIPAAPASSHLPADAGDSMSNLARCAHTVLFTAAAAAAAALAFNVIRSFQRYPPSQ
jgi:hypothetical protein